MMRLSKWLGSGLAAGALVVLGCSGAEAQPAAAAAQAAASEDPSGMGHLGLIREALDKVTLRPDQKTQVEQMVSAAQARHEPIRAAHVALRTALADQVLAGKVDRAALKPQIDALLAAVDKARPEDRAALMRLHDLLDKNQRDQLVNAVESSMRGRMQGHMMGKKGEGGPHQWATDLNLTDQQREQIRAVMHEQFHHDGPDAGREQWRAAHEQHRRVLQSFREDKFTLDDSGLFGRDRMEQGISRMIDFAGAVVPILRPDQRAIAAQKLKTEGFKH